MKSKRYHIIYDVEAENIKNINAELVKKLLTELPPLIDMKILHGPVVVEGVPENPGYTGFVVIDYSHISIHQFSDNNEALIDIFSCKEYSRDIAMNYLIKSLGVKKENVNVKTVSWA